MNKLKYLTEKISRAVYLCISLSLGIISLAMIIYAIFDILTSFHDRALLATALLDAIGLIVIGMAVFDVSKFLLEEEVLDVHANKTNVTRRATLVKFLTIIIIAIFLESLVNLFAAAKKDISLLIYPTLLIFVGVLFVIGLGVYQKLTQEEDNQ
ncbi:general glycosylation pathway protein [Halomonas aestuarii]|uniref:general glycosylation pathway protein n=1 Tax=Halomonas aestuarii TaxID=1897729 RepID=UPI001AD82556|nr:general glycosylation pathway protein [Halomonas aestuarii]